MITYVVHRALDQKCYISIVDLFVLKPEPATAIEMQFVTGYHLTTQSAPGLLDTRVMAKTRPTCPKYHSILQLSNPILTYNKGFCPVFANRTLNQVGRDQRDHQGFLDFHGHGLNRHSRAEPCACVRKIWGPSKNRVWLGQLSGR